MKIGVTKRGKVYVLRVSVFGYSDYEFATKEAADTAAKAVAIACKDAQDLLRREFRELMGLQKG